MQKIDTFIGTDYTDYHLYKSGSGYCLLCRFDGKYTLQEYSLSEWYELKDQESPEINV